MGPAKSWVRLKEGQGVLGVRGFRECRVLLTRHARRNWPT